MQRSVIIVRVCTLVSFVLSDRRRRRSHGRADIRWYVVVIIIIITTTAIIIIIVIAVGPDGRVSSVGLPTVVAGRAAVQLRAANL